MVTAEQMTERAYQGWLTDHLDGRNPLLIASTNDQAAELAARARADLVRAGLVEEDGVLLRTGAAWRPRPAAETWSSCAATTGTSQPRAAAFAVNRAVARSPGSATTVP